MQNPFARHPLSLVAGMMGEKYGVLPSRLLGYVGTRGQEFFYNLRVTSLVAQKTNEAVEQARSESSIGGVAPPSIASTKDRVRQLEGQYGRAPDAENVRRLLAAA